MGADLQQLFLSVSDLWQNIILKNIHQMVKKKEKFLICHFNISFSLLLRFTDDTFDPELAATIGKPVFKISVEMPYIFSCLQSVLSKSFYPLSHHPIASVSVELFFIFQGLTWFR